MMKTKTRIIIAICFLILFFLVVITYKSCHKEKLSQTEVAVTDDGTIVFCYEDDKGNEYIKFGNGPIEEAIK